MYLKDFTISVVVVFFSALILVSCGVRYSSVGLNFDTFTEEKRKAEETGLCVWVHGEADPQYTSKFDFGCHGGEYGTVSLFYDRVKGEADQVSKVRLLWKKWHPNMHIVDEEVMARAFVDYMARRYAPDLSPLLHDAFFGTSDKGFETTRLVFEYTHTPYENYDLHRMEIRERETLPFLD